MTTAKWKGRRIDYRHYEYQCSKCGYQLRYKKPFYCPGCGSQMVEERNMTMKGNWKLGAEAVRENPARSAPSTSVGM